MSKRRLACVAAAFGWMAALAQPAAQAPSLNDVLKRSAAYVANFHKQLSGIVAEESYRQEVITNSRWANSLLVNPTRQLRSDLLLLWASDSWIPGLPRYVELRDVFEVDGAPIRDRQERLEKLLKDRTAAADARIGSIIDESARYNIGTITRNINTPLMTLQFLEELNQPNFRFKHIEKAEAVFRNKQDLAANDAPVFRVSTEMWTVEYQERGRRTIIKRPDGSNMPARGRFWINPNNGSVLISELIVDGGGVVATVTVSYQSEPLMGFLVPVEMRESYVRSGERITGHAEYGRFRSLSKD